MTKILISIIIIIIVILLWVWYMECNHPVFDTVWLDTVIQTCRTGDIILFKATDNVNSSKIFCYYTHIGIIWRESPSHEPMIFEAAGINDTDLYEHENQNGIFFCSLKTRLERYKGKTYIKYINMEVAPHLNKDFLDFVEYAKANMYYNYGVLFNGIKKGLGLEKCNEATNCAELTMLSLIKLGIIEPDSYNENRFHHLYWLCNLVKGRENYNYDEPLRIKISPFSDNVNVVDVLPKVL
jgi:hypothetical protein